MFGLAGGVRSRTVALGAPRFPAGVDVVRLSVLVHGKGHPLLGLRAADFEVDDNGVAQRIESVVSEEIPLSLVLALDVSGSVQGESLAELKRACDELITGLREPDRAALLTFADTLRLPVSLGSDRDLIHRRLEALEAVGGTSLRDGAFTAMTLGEAAGGRALAILFTDGEESVSWLGESEVLEAARRTPVVVYGVRIGEKDAPFLGQVVKATGGRTLHLRSARELSGAFAEILQEFRTRYVVSYTPRRVVRSGWHRTSVRVKGRSARVLVREGYSVP